MSATIVLKGAVNQNGLKNTAIDLSAQFIVVFINFFFFETLSKMDPKSKISMFYLMLGLIIMIQIEKLKGSRNLSLYLRTIIL